MQDGTIYLDSPAAYILSGADMTIDADTVDNEYSFITAGNDLDLTTDKLTNIGYKNIKRTTETGTDVKYWKYKNIEDYIVIVTMFMVKTVHLTICIPVS